MMGYLRHTWLLLLLKLTSALPQMRTAPEECPMANGNVIDTVLFVDGDEACSDLCSASDTCLFFFFYPGTGSNDIDAVEGPPQCFLFSSCNRDVLPATPDCPLNKENVARVEAFVADEPACMQSCSQDEKCGYYLHLNESDANQPLMCYHLKTCASRNIRNQACPLEQNNYIDHSLFVPSNEDCEQLCQDTSMCRFYFWYPIDFSPAPNYCYLFRSCTGGGSEPAVGLAAGGRHPGDYFLGDLVNMDLIKVGADCPKAVLPNATNIGRAGAIAEFVDNQVIMCGGRDINNQVLSDCLAYEPASNTWLIDTVNSLRVAREEAASAIINGDMYVLGGFVDGQRSISSERLSSIRGGVWIAGPDLPEPRARFCAVNVDATRLAMVGGETEESAATPTLRLLDTSEEETGSTWTEGPDMLAARKDHACIIATLDDRQGILVTGGVDAEDTVLDSVEFYDIEGESWTVLTPLKRARTEHGMALVGGKPMVMGGVTEGAFLASIEVLDDTDDEEAVLGLQWSNAAFALSRPRYDFPVAQIPLSALPDDEKSLDQCSIDEEQGDNV